MLRWSDLPLSPDETTLRRFAGLCLLAFGGLAGYEYLIRGRVAVAAVLAVLAATIGPIGLIRPRMVRPVFVGWIIAAFPIGFVFSTVLLALFYYGLMTPLGLILRLSGRDPLRLRRRTESSTYWTPKPAVTDVRRYLRES